MSPHAARIPCRLVPAALLACALLPARPAAAANPSGGLRIEVMAAYNLVVDSNVESPSTYAPRSAYLGAKFINDGTDALTNVVAYIGNFSGIGSTNTPGVYPRRAHPPLVGPLPGNTFALTHEGGSWGVGDATRVLGTLLPGQSVMVYWLVSYPNKDALGKAVWGPSVKPDDDLWLEYDIWATAGRAGATVTADQTRRVTMRNEISAAANKILPNSANKVPQKYLDLLQQYVPSWTNNPQDGTPGTRITTEGYWYDLGNIGQGFDNNGDLVPDKNAWMQPVGDPALFDPSCFRLTRTRALVIVKLKGGGEQVYSVEDQLYFENVPDNNGAVGWVGYEFDVLRGACSGVMTPYQEVASGFDNEKFNGDFGATLGAPLASGTSRVDMAKAVDRSVAAPGATLSYAIGFTNRGAVAIGSPSNGSPLVIQDRIPTGTAYIAGSATASNVLPAGVSAYTVYFSTNNGTSWQSGEPALVANITHVQWWLSHALPTGASGIVRFQVTVASPYPLASPLLVNTGALSIGSTAPFLERTATTLVTGTNRLGDRVYADDGTGGGTFGNKLQDGAEPGLPNVTVRLYLDANTNGVLDATDLALLTNTTDGTGTYLFTNLLDGAYLAVVDTGSAGIPSGYSLTTAGSFAADLDKARTNNNAVAYLEADFGFAPLLSLAKTGTNTVYEGRTLTYTISVTNRLPGDGTGVGAPARYTLWATNAVSVVGWQNGANAYRPSAPDGIYATSTLNNNNDTIDLVGFFTAQQAGTITNVQMVTVLATNGGYRAGDKVMATLLYNGTMLRSVTNTASAITNGEWAVDATSARSWQWADFTSANTVTVRVITDKGQGSSPGGQILLDQGGLRLTTDQTLGESSGATTLNPVPLVDTFTTSQLQYVSATPTPSLVTNAGSAGLLYWANLGPLYPGGGRSVTVTFKALEPLNNTASTLTNLAAVTNAYYLSGVSAGRATSQVTSAVQPAGTIGDFVWRDLNGDGVQDGGSEAGIPGVCVVLSASANIDLGRGIGLPVTNTTDASGYYLFEGLPATGVYTVRVLTATLPGGTGVNTFDRDGNKDSATVITNLNPAATNGQDKVLDADFGYQVGTTIEGALWHDANRNGTATRDSGEDPLTGVTVYVCNNVSPCGAGSALATNVTDANGEFRFVGNYAGTLFVTVNTNSGALSSGTWARSFDTDGLTTTNYAAVTAVAGGVARADFSYYRQAAFTIGDTLFYDWNGNGAQNANDEGIPNITVWLYKDANTNGVVDDGVDLLLATATTDVNGQYLFTNRPPTNYLVIVDHADPDFPPLYFVTADPQGALDGRSAFVLSTANRLDQDFGYQPYGSGAIGDTVWRDANGDQAQSGAQETGIASVPVSLYVDMNGDGAFVLLATTNTDTSGRYLFANLPAATYRVVVDGTSTNIPMDPFGNPYRPTTSTNYTIALAGGTTNRAADFGFAPPGAIGDTIFWDNNGNGLQDWNEPGITSVTVRLFRDVNANGLYDPGTDTLLSSTTTDTNGAYLFTGLATGRYVVVVSNGGAIASATLTADPNADGVPCSDPGAAGCDGAYGVRLDVGTSFMGADFGYQPPGALGDQLWVDTNNNGIQDDGEAGIPFITIQLYTGATLVASTETDGDGRYAFGNLPNGTYRVVVLTSDADFPAGLAASYDADGTLDSQADSIVISNGAVLSIGGQACADCSLAVDFGYRYAGNNALSGTVGLDALPYDGRLGTGVSGVSADEAPFAGATVLIYLWNDDGDQVIAPGEMVLLGSALTAMNGDYSFTGLPSGSGSSRYVVSLAAPAEKLRLTTTSGSTPALSVTNFVNLQNETISAYQVVAIAAVVTDIDFAFVSAIDYDYGDLLQTYSTRLEGSPIGARHVVPAAPNLYLGLTVDAEPNGTPSVLADGDGADEDGVVPVGVWRAGTGGGRVRTTVGAGSGWLVGFMDFNGDGDLSDPGELIVNAAAASTGGNGAGVYTNSFTIPTGALSSTAAQSQVYARFRLFPSEPAFPDLAFAGTADNGEVEDYLFVLGSIGDLVWLDDNANGIQDEDEQALPGIRVFLDLDGDGLYTAGEPAATTTVAGAYTIGGLNSGAYSVRIDTNTLPFGVKAVYDLDGADSPHVAAATLTNGQVRTDADFGYQLTATNASFTLDKAVVLPPGRPANIGEIIQFRITITNTGDSLFATVPLEDRYDTNYLTYVQAAPPTVNNVNDGTVNWADLGALGPGASTSVLVTFTARAATPAARSNLAVAAPTVQLGSVPSARTAAAPYEVASSTFAPVYDLRATHDGVTTRVEWETGAEVGAAAFQVWRIAGGEEPILVTPEPVPASGAAQGAFYRVPDPAAAAGATYAYTIEEIEDNGARTPYGPFTVVVQTAKRGRAATDAAVGPRATQPVPAAPSAASLAAAGGDLAALAVSAEGVYGISASSLASVWGLAPAEVEGKIRAEDVEVRHAGRRIPSVGTDSGTSLYFYARGWADLFAPNDVFYVLPGRNVRLAADPPPTSALAAVSFVDTLRIESNKTAVMSLVQDPGEDYWMWEQIIGGQAGSNRRTLPVVLRTAPASGPARLAVRLLGGNNSDADLDHHALVRVNGSTIGETRWDGKTSLLAGWDFDAALLRAGTNTVEVEGIRDPGVSLTLFYIDYLTLDYPRPYTAVDGWLRFSAMDGRAVTVTGFPSPDIRVLDITDPEQAQRVGWALAGGGPGAAWVTLPGTQPGHTYLAFAPSAARTPLPVAADRAAALASPTNAVDYLVVAGPGLETAAANLAAYRAGQGLRVRVVPLGDVYSAFGQGVAGPDAVRAFLAYAARYWTVAPRYVVLAGDGTYDYKNHLGFMDQVVPPALVSTPSGLFSSDAPYADTDGDGRPDLALGRLPARTAAELQRMVDRVIAYEAATGPWTTNAFLLADNADSGGDFEADIDAVHSNVATRFAAARCYLGRTTITDARQQTIGALNRGVAVLNYSGHGALDRFAQEGILLSSDVAALTNSVRAPLVVSMTCVVGRYSVPGFPCLAEDLLTHTNGGASAVIAPVGLSSDRAAQRLNLHVSRLLATSTGLRLGDLWLQATSAYVDEGLDPYILGIYNVLGDPAQVLK